MSEHFDRSINQPISSPATIRNFLSQAGFTGTTDTAVIRMNGAASVNTGSAFTEVTTAAAGTIITVGEPGLYLATFHWTITGAVSIGVGIGIDLAAAPIVADPAFATAGVIAADDPITGVAALLFGGDISATFEVTGAEAATGLLVRMLATDSAGGAPVGMVAAGIYYRITKIGEIAT